MCVFMQVYSRLPVQKLSGYSYEVADADFNPCMFLPVLGPGIRRFSSRPFPENDQKNDVYNIFKVKHVIFLLVLNNGL